MAGSTESLVRGDEPPSEIDLRAIGSALHRRRRFVIVPTAAVFLLVTIFVFVATPRYTAETQILLENQETFFTRPDRINLPTEISNQLDETAVASQVQLVSSPDIARQVINQLKLRQNPDFDPAAGGGSVFARLMTTLGLRDRSEDDARVVNTFLKKLSVFSPSKTRVITIQFTARDPVLAAKIANTIAEDYLAAQSSAKRAMAKASAEALARQIADLKVKVVKADDAREQYRLASGLLAGGNNMTLSGQQLADINSDLSKARTAQADAQAKASMIRELLKEGKAADVPDVTNNDIVRRVYDERANAQAQLALESRTLLPEHPRIQELTAQVEQYDKALKTAARQAASSLENEAKIAGTTVANLEAVLTQQKKAAGVANVDEVHLHALERVAQSLKDQLDSSTTKYEEALARQSSDATPADARIINRATPPQDPSFPKKVPYILFGTIAAFVLSFGYVVAAELLTGRALVGYRDGMPGTGSHPGEQVGIGAGVASGSSLRPSIWRVPARGVQTEDRSADLSELPDIPTDRLEGRKASAWSVATDEAAAEDALIQQATVQQAAVRQALAENTAADRPDPTRSHFRLPGGLRRTQWDDTSGVADEGEDLVFHDQAPSPRPPASSSVANLRRHITAGLGLLGGVVANVRAFGLSAAETRVGREEPVAPTVRWDDEPVVASAFARDAAEPFAGASSHSQSASRSLGAATLAQGADEPPRHGEGPLVAAGTATAVAAGTSPQEAARGRDRLLTRIVSAHVPGRGLRIVGTTLGDGSAETSIVIDLARTLSSKGRSILVDLNRSPAKLAVLRNSEGHGLATVMTMTGLAELLAGEASFAEVIHRDEASRLHFVPAGAGDADFRDFDLVLDALSETYDFIVLLIPSVQRSDIARVMSPYADFIVLAAEPDAPGAILTGWRRELVEAGAREVLVAGRDEDDQRLTA